MDASTLLQSTRAWLDGDETAARTLFSFFYPRVFRFFELRAARAAADLTQRTLLVCLEKRGAVRNPAAFRAFVFGVARRQLLEHIRTEQRSRNIQDALSAVAREASTSVSAVYVRTQEQRILIQSLLELPPEASMLLGLYHWEGLSTVEIATVLEVPASTVTTRLSRARAKLRAEVLLLSRPGRAQESLLEDLDAWLRRLTSEALLAGVPVRAFG